jgi:hypothetical protein
MPNVRHPLGELASACIVLKGCVVPVAHTFQSLDVPLDVGDTNLRTGLFSDTKHIHANTDRTRDDSFLAPGETVYYLRIVQDWQNYYCLILKCLDSSSQIYVLLG